MTEVESEERTLVGVYHLLGLVDDSVGDVHPLVCDIVDHRLEVPAFDSGSNVRNGVFDGDFSVVFSKEIVKPLVVCRAHPIHRVVNDILNHRMPGIILR